MIGSVARMYPATLRFVVIGGTETVARRSGTAPALRP
jgi:hypothetical protein